MRISRLVVLPHLECVEMISVTINGLSRQAPAGATLGDVLRERSISEGSARGVAVAINDRIVRRTDWDSTPLCAGIRIEIVTARQGG
jgi:sulfur carrier protein